MMAEAYRIKQYSTEFYFLRLKEGLDNLLNQISQNGCK